MEDYIKYFPKPLLEDIIHNRTLPFIGSGFSLNAKIPDGKTMKMWKALGDAFAEDLMGYEGTSPIDSISEYEQLYHRTAMVEKMRKELLVGEAEIGDTHKEFCSLPFDKVCTTNFDFLLEDGYRFCKHPFMVKVDEQLLPMSCTTEEVELLKIHGDIDHPLQMVATEQDYDSFLNQHPLMATYISNLLMTRSPLFIGYSVDDTDFRQIYQVIKSRIGSMIRPAYCIEVGATYEKIERYRRRGIHVINLPKTGDGYKTIFPELFRQLRMYWQKETTAIFRSGTVFNSQLLYPDRNNKLCFFLSTNSKLSEYKDDVYEALKELDMMPVDCYDLLGSNFYAELTIAVNRSAYVFFDLDSDVLIPDDFEMHYDKDHLFFLSSVKDVSLMSAKGFKTLHKEYNEYQDLDIEKFTQAIIEVIKKEQETPQEFEQLLNDGYYQAAIISCVGFLERKLRDVLGITSYRGLTDLLHKAVEEKKLKKSDIHDLQGVIMMRNKAVHEDFPLSKEDAVYAINNVTAILKTIK